MPFALLIFGVIFIVAAVRGTDQNLFGLLKDDFTGDKNFFIWVVAIVFIVAVGNVRALRPVSNAFLGLVILVIILQNGKRGLFQNFIDQVKQGTSGSGGSNIFQDPINQINLGGGKVFQDFLTGLEHKAGL